MTLRDETVDVCNSAGFALINAISQQKVVNTLIDTIGNKDELVRATVAEVLGNATAQPKVINALLEALHDTSDAVRSDSAEALTHLVRQPGSEIFTDLPQKLLASFSLPGMDEPEWNRPRHHLFDALMAVAPGPKV